MARNSGSQEGGTNAAVIERDVDEAAVEQSLKDEGKKAPKLESTGKGISRFDFIRRAQTYKPKITIVDLPEPFAGEQIKVRELTAGERDRYEAKLIRGRMGNQKLNMEDIRINLVVAATVEWEDESTPMFTERDIPDLRKMGISVIQAIYDAASKLSAVSKEDEDELLGN